MILQRLSLLVVFGVILSQLSAQVEASLYFPDVDQKFKIFFDASQGNQGLININESVYLHTGLITSNSTNGGDWKHVQGVWGQEIERLKMNREGQNLFTFEFTPREFYSIPEGEQVQSIAFVFRNGDGSREGKTASGGDIFLDVYEPDAGPHIRILKPTESNTLLQADDTFALSIVASDTVDVTYSVDDNSFPCMTLLPEEPYMSDDISQVDAEVHSVSVFTVCDNPSELSTFQFVRIQSQGATKDIEGDFQFGLTRLGADSIRVVLQAPNKSSVHVLGTFNNWAPSNASLMYRSTDGEYFWKDVPIDNTEEWHSYQYLIDESITIADPLSTLILDPNDDAAVPYELPDINIPNNVAATLFHMSPPSFDWQGDSFEKPTTDELVVYEILLRDFMPDQQSFMGLVDSLDYLERLGINAIELMPINEFEGNDSWGYNPSYHNALDKFYGTPEQFKTLVREAHKRGIAIIVDVVFNHAFGQNPLARMYWNNSQNRPSADNPWFNEVSKDPLVFGSDFNHQSPYTQSYVEQILKYWLEEYHIDGYRFDLSKGFTQRASSDFDSWAQLDPERVQVIKDYADVIRQTSPDAYVILEHFAYDEEQRELSDYGCLFWNNGNHNVNEATMGYVENKKSDMSFLYFADRGYNQAGLINYMESHDEERLAYKNQEFGNSNGNYNVKDFDVSVDRVKLATAIFYLIPGPKMLWQFGELAYDYSINRCTDGSISDGCRLSRKPGGFDLYEDDKRKELFNWTADMIHLSQEYELYAPDTFIYDLEEAGKSLTVESDSISVVAMGNFDVSALEVSAQFPSEGMWYNYESGDSTVVSTVGRQTKMMDAGAYEVWTNRKVARASQGSLVTSVDRVLDLTTGEPLFQVGMRDGHSAIVVSPNSRLKSRWHAQIINIAGQHILNYELSRSETTRKDLTQLPTGIYVLQLSDGIQREAHKFFKK